MKEPINKVFQGLVDLRLLLTSNFREFEAGINQIDEWVTIYWNGDDNLYEFKVSTPDNTFTVAYYGLPQMSIRGQADDLNEIIIDSIFEITQTINNWLIK